MITAARSIRTIRRPSPREPRKRPSQIRQPPIRIGMEVVIEVSCELRGCGQRSSWRHGQDLFYHGVIEQKRGDRYLVVTRLYGSFWAGREHMFARDPNGRTWTTPLLVEA